MTAWGRRRPYFRTHSDTVPTQHCWARAETRHDRPRVGRDDPHLCSLGEIRGGKEVST